MQSSRNSRPTCVAIIPSRVKVSDSIERTVDTEERQDRCIFVIQETFACWHAVPRRLFNSAHIYTRRQDVETKETNRIKRLCTVQAELAYRSMRNKYRDDEQIGRPRSRGSCPGEG